MKSPKPIPKAKSLMPPEFARILGARPTLWFESDDDYDSLLSQLLAEHDPNGVTEFLLVKDLADVTWEVHRLRLLKGAAIHAELPDAAWSILRDVYPGGRSMLQPLSFTKTVRLTASGLKDETASVQKLCKEAGVSQHELYHEAFRRSLKTISAINQAAENAERRRDRIMRLLDDRRKNQPTMSSLVDTSKELTDLDVDKVISGGSAT